MSYVPGYGRLTVAEHAAVVEMVRMGMTFAAVGAHYGVTRNTIAGVWARSGNGIPKNEPGTMGQRLDALHARLDAVLAETRDIGRLPPLPPQRRYPRR